MGGSGPLPNVCCGFGSVIKYRALRPLRQGCFDVELRCRGLDGSADSSWLLTATTPSPTPAPILLPAAFAFATLHRGLATVLLYARHRREAVWTGWAVLSTKYDMSSCQGGSLAADDTEHESETPG